MGAGLPVLGIESPGVADTVNDGEDGYIVPEEDLAAFTAKMVRLVTETDKRKQMSAQARKTSELYDYRRTNKHMLDLYQRVVQTTTGRRRNIRARWIRLWDQLRR